MSLNGYTALVTGAARGIGKAIALQLARDGANLALLDLSDDLEKSAKDVLVEGNQVVPVKADVSDADAVASAVEEASQSLGGIDILVNNAGLVKNIAPVGRMKAKAWQQELDVNLSGPFNMIQATIGPMVERGWGRIINISSVAARGGLHYQAGYSASKNGLLGLTHTVTLEYARHGITCNAILPGVVETENVGAMPKPVRDTVEAMVPARRMGKVEEVAHLAAFLASDKAAYINGAEIDIDGGTRLNSLTLGSQRELRERADALAKAFEE